MRYVPSIRCVFQKEQKINNVLVQCYSEDKYNEAIQVAKENLKINCPTLKDIVIASESDDEGIKEYYNERKTWLETLKVIKKCDMILGVAQMHNEDVFFCDCEIWLREED